MWNFTVLGEAITQLSESTKAAYPNVLWRDPVRLRNRIVHGYWSVDLEILIAAAHDDLPDFLVAVQAVQAIVSAAEE